MVHPLIDALVNASNEIETAKAEDDAPRPEPENVADDLSPTKKAVIEMLVENTGVHMLDSGGAYGRAWQRNRAVTNWDDMPDIRIEVWNAERCQFNVYKSTYHFLVDHLTFDDEAMRLTEWFKAWSGMGDMKDKPWIRCMEKFHESLVDADGGWSMNTYDSESSLDQVLQYVSFNWNGEDWLILQIHGGCDIRGGYTEPKIFKVGDFDEFHLEMNDLGAECTGDCWRFVSYDGGYRWEMDDIDTKRVLKIVDRAASRGLVQETLDGKKVDPLADINEIGDCMELDEENHSAKCKFCGNPVRFW